MRRGFRLGSVRGVDVVADLSLFIIAGLLTWSLYADLDQAFPMARSTATLIGALAGGGLFFVSIFLHELSHSLVALRRGLSVRRIRLFIFGGVSEIEQEAESPADELAVTAAGPAVSLILGILFIAVGWPLAEMIELPARVAMILGVANLSIGVFNLLPGFPLDGGRLLRALVWKRSGDRGRATRLAVNTGRGLGALLMLGGGAIGFLYLDISAIWVMAIGWFIYEAATTSAVQEKFASRIEGLTVGDVMRRTEMAVDGESTVAAALELHGWGEKLRPLPVDVEGRITGVFGTREVVLVDSADRSSTLVRDAMAVIGPADVVQIETPLRQALTPGDRTSDVMVIVNEGEVVGLVTAEELSSLFSDLKRGGASR